MPTAIRCATCKDPIVTDDCLVATMAHVPAGAKGCSITFTWTPVITLMPGAVALGSLGCAECYLLAWAEAHMRPKVEVTSVSVQ